MFNSTSAPTFAHGAATTTAVAWNGPICGTCSARYLGHHSCSREDLQRLIDKLTRLRDSLDD
jgi:hypothetical protein